MSFRFFGYSKICFFLLSRVNMRECLLVCSCIWLFFFFWFYFILFQVWIPLHYCQWHLALAKCCGVTADFFGRWLYLYFTCLPIRNVVLELLCLIILVSCVYFCCFVCSAAHKQLLVLFDLGSFISRVNKCSGVIFILKRVCLWAEQYYFNTVTLNYCQNVWSCCYLLLEFTQGYLSPG